MPNQPRLSISRLMLQRQLNKFYSHPVAQVSVGLSLTIICVGFFALVAIKPTLETMANLLKQIEDKRTIDQKLSLKITSLASAQAELAKKGQAAQVINLAVPPTPQFNTLVKMLEKEATLHQVVVMSLSFPTIPLERDPNHTGTELESIPFTISLSGPYSELYAALQDLQNFQRILIIDRIDLVPSADTISSDLVMSISGRAFAFSPTAIKKTAK